MNTIIYDENHVKDFIDILPDLNNLEVYFISLSCRNKYLSDDERAAYAIGRTEMFGKQIARNREKLFRSIRRYETHPEAYTTKNQECIPNKAMVCYVNLDTSSSLKAYHIFSNKMQENIFNLTSNSLHGNSIIDSCSSINKLDNILMSSYQQAHSTKKFIDIDFDIPKDAWNLVDILLEDIKQHKIPAYIIETHGGYHVLLEKNYIKYNFNQTIEHCNKVAKEQLNNIKYEIKVNDNKMVPVPGTLQANHKVKFWKV